MKGKMDFALNRLVLLTGCFVSINAIMESCGMKIALQSKKITGMSFWEQNGTWDKLACAVFCMKNLNCKTFVYSWSLKTCRGYPDSLDYDENHLTDGESGDIIAVTTYRAATTHGKSCSRDEECSIHKSVCYGGLCLCEPGLYFSPNQNTCLKNCTEYGPEMDIYKGAAIVGHNNRSWPTSSLFKCCEGCVQEKSFNCLTADYTDKEGYCHLSSLGFLDAAISEREQKMPHWFLAQRQCKK